MPAGTLRSALLEEPLHTGSQPHRSHHNHHNHGSGCDSGACSWMTGAHALSHRLSRRANAAAFLDAEIPLYSRRTGSTSFSKSGEHPEEVVGGTDKEEVLAEKEVLEDQEALSNMERKVDNALIELRQNTERKVDEFFQTMRQAYGVPFGSGLGGGTGPGSAADDGQPWEGPKVRVKIPDLPPGKHAVIQLVRQQPINAGGHPADSQAQALSSLVSRLDNVMKKVTGQEEDPMTAEKTNDPLNQELAPPPPPGSMGELMLKLKRIQANLSPDPQAEERQNMALGGSHEDVADVGAQLQKLAHQPLPKFKAHPYKLPWPAQMVPVSEEEGPAEEHVGAEDM